ncbi:hypothetical protein [Photobacterium kishitanii]|uniref:Uncharacterized protein n=1 Tax=Photobacterium kishitanii TaxID=318456 RepID=A0A2T3KLB7_9GAMM|nr:hypothetical protein [Photobacterium kishitanii]PSV00514.1 hypothetical protein C9J27_05110 [Photobacterium kishitanii]
MSVLISSSFEKKTIAANEKANEAYLNLVKNGWKNSMPDAKYLTPIGKGVATIYVDIESIDQLKKILTSNKWLTIYSVIGGANGDSERVEMNEGEVLSELSKRYPFKKGQINNAKALLHTTSTVGLAHTDAYSRSVSVFEKNENGELIRWELCLMENQYDVASCFDLLEKLKGKALVKTYFQGDSILAI